MNGLECMFTLLQGGLHPPCEGWALDPLVQMPVSHVGVSMFESQVYFLIPAFCFGGLWEVAGEDQKIRSLPPICETWIELLVLSLDPGSSSSC